MSTIPPIHADTPTWRDEEAFCEALRQGRADGVRGFLERFGKQIADTKFPRGDTGLHWSSWCHDNAIVRMLIDAEADINLKDSYGDTPLHIAARSHNNEVVGLLLQQGALTDAANKSGNTALQEARAYGNQAAVRLIEACEKQRSLAASHLHQKDQERAVAEAQKKLKALSPPISFKKKPPSPGK